MLHSHDFFWRNKKRGFFTKLRFGWVTMCDYDCYMYIYIYILNTLRIMGSQVTGGLEIQKNPAKNRVSHPSFLEGPS